MTIARERHKNYRQRSQTGRQARTTGKLQIQQIFGETHVVVSVIVYPPRKKLKSATVMESISVRIFFVYYLALKVGAISLLECTQATGEKRSESTFSLQGSQWEVLLGKGEGLWLK